jgi:uncharacterized membrane protein
MPMDTNKEHQVERLVHYTLRAGVSISATLLAVGLFVVIVRDTPRPAVAPPLSEILRLAFTANEVGGLYLGLLLLMAIPVTLVAMLAYGYARIGWQRFALVALLVLLLLGTGLALGIRG